MSRKDLRDPTASRRVFVMRNTATRKAVLWERHLHATDCPYGEHIRRIAQAPRPVTAFTVAACTCSWPLRVLALHRPSRFGDRLVERNGQPVVRAEGLRTGRLR
jgi:hypothetical protein